MSNWTSGDVASNGITMHYYRTGSSDSGKPVLVLAHGATDSGLCWSRVAAALESDFDVIMPDARGHGQSSAATSFTAEDHAADLAGFIEALGLDRPAVGGHSMGAGATLRLVADYPDIARCAILEDPPIWQTPPDFSRSPRTGIQQVVAEARVDDLATTIAKGRANSPLWSDEEWQPWAESKQQVSDAFMNSFGQRSIPGDWRELLPRIRVPVLLVTSDVERGGIVSPEAAAEAQSLLPSLQVVRLEGAGHNIRRERFDGFVAAVCSFLQAH